MAAASPERVRLLAFSLKVVCETCPHCTLQKERISSCFKVLRTSKLLGAVVFGLEEQYMGTIKAAHLYLASTE